MAALEASVKAAKAARARHPAAGAEVISAERGDEARSQEEGAGKEEVRLGPPVPPSERTWVEIEGRRLSVTNLDKVLYPLVGFTKAQVIDYYVRIAPTLLEHIGDRGVTLRRWPNGVNEQSFFEKRCPSHRPDWMKTCGGPGDRGGSIDYCCVGEVAALAWTANLAALEIHAPMARCGDIETPTMVVFDLDPGAPATIVECCQVALDVRDVLDHLGLESFAKTSGSKGMQLYVPLNTATHPRTGVVVRARDRATLGKAVPATRHRRRWPKAARPNKIFVDWSQNSRHKTTIAPYSLRALERPTVSTPIDWDEVAAGAEGEPLIFEAADVLDTHRRAGRSVRRDAHPGTRAAPTPRVIAGLVRSGSVPTSPRNPDLGRSDLGQPDLDKPELAARWFPGRNLVTTLRYRGRDYRYRSLFDVLRRHCRGRVLDVGGGSFVDDGDRRACAVP